MRYTGRFAMKWGVQQRVLRKEHPGMRQVVIVSKSANIDAHYCAALYLYIRTFACRFREFTLMAFTDDKVRGVVCHWDL